MFERIFHLRENQTTVRTELLAGLTTFMTMAYVVVVNPRILSEAGMPVEGVLFATCTSAALATLVMGMWANYPIALAPGMSLNAYFTYSIVIGRGVPWQTALGVVFLSGVLFLILTLTNIREQIVNGIPDCLKHGTAAGIGLFIAFVGFRNANIIVANASTFVAFGKASDPQVILAALGVMLIAILMVRRVGSAILIGIVAITLVGIPLGVSHWPAHLFSLPHPSGTFLKLDLRSATKLGLGELVFVFFFVDLIRQRGNARRRLRAGRISAGWQTAAREPRSAGGRLRHNRWRADRHVHGYELYRKRGGSRGGSAYGPGQSGDRGAIWRGDVLRAARGRDSVLRHRAGADFGWRADVRRRRQGEVGRLHRLRSRVSYSHRHAADVQHCDRPEPGASVVHFPETFHRTGTAKSVR